MVGLACEDSVDDAGPELKQQVSDRLASEKLREAAYGGIGGAQSLILVVSGGWDLDWDWEIGGRLGVACCGAGRPAGVVVAVAQAPETASLLSPGLRINGRARVL